MKIFYPLFTGFAVGALFTLLRLPIPAPAVIEGVIGIFGIYLGLKIIGLLQ